MLRLTNRPLFTLSPLALLFALALPRPAAAEQAKTLTLEQALDAARENSRDLKAAVARVDQSRAQITQAWALLLPQLSAQGRLTHNNKQVELDLAAQNAPLLGLSGALKQGATPSVVDALNQFEAGLMANTPDNAVIQEQNQIDGTITLSVPVLVPSAWFGLAASKRWVEAQAAGYDATRALLLLQVAGAFYLAAGADELLLVQEHAIAVCKETLDNAQARFQTGVVNRVEVTRAQLALLRAEQTAVETKANGEQAYRALATLIGVELPLKVVPPPEQPTVTASDRAKLVADAQKTRPELIVLERTVASNESLEWAATWRWAPSLSAFALARVSNNSGFSGDTASWAIGAQLDWLIFDGGVRIAQHQLAEAQREETEAKLDQLRDTIADEIANAQDTVGTKQNALLTAHRSVELSSETLELVKAQHDVGTATQVDLLLAQDASVVAGVALAQARFDLAMAQLQLARVAGTFPDRGESHE